METKIKSLSYNAMFEVVFFENINVIVALNNDCCGTSYLCDVDDIKIEKREVPRKNIQEKALKCDYIVIINEFHLYNLEINRRFYTGLVERNWTYILKLHASRVPVGTRYRDFKKYYSRQINFNRYRNASGVAVDQQAFVSLVDSNSFSLENLGVFQFDIEFCYQIVYNCGGEDISKISKLYRWGAIFLAETLEEIDYILGKDMLPMKEKKKFLRSIETASCSKGILDSISLEEDFDGSVEDEIEIAREQAKKEALEQGLQEGIEKGIEQGIEKGIEQGIMQGIEQSTFQIIQSMLKCQTEIEFISKVTGKSVSEIMKIKESLEI